jgi:SAM-dependent methyltransferase
MVRLHSPFFSGSNDIKDLLPALLRRRQAELTGKDILDVPAGEGDTSQLLLDLGANVTASDLYPEYFRYPAIPCVKANLNDKLPFADASFDVVICQEGIEHMPNQLHLFQEVNRVLRTGGRAIVTTPNYSNLRSRLSYLLLESEAYRLMPPNEVDSVWASDNAKTLQEVYLGHIFFANLTRQRALAVLSGFQLVEVHPTRVNYTSLALLPFFALWMRLATWRAKRRGSKREQFNPKRAGIYDELTQLNNSLNVLTGGHLITEYQKHQDTGQAVTALVEAKLGKFAIPTS